MESKTDCVWYLPLATLWKCLTSLFLIRRGCITMRC